MSDTLYLLDTNIVLTLVRGNALAAYINASFGFLELKVRPMVCVVTHGEVRVLAGLNHWGKNKLKTLERALDNLVTVDINHPSVLDSYVEIDLYSQSHPRGSSQHGKRTTSGSPLVRRLPARRC